MDIMIFQATILLLAILLLPNHFNNYIEDIDNYMDDPLDIDRLKYDHAYAVSLIRVIKEVDLDRKIVKIFSQNRNLA